MIDRFEINDHDARHPKAERILFCDGTGGNLFRENTDLEQSHWRPNHTPAEFRAGTSTEICFRFLDNPRPGPWTVAVNNHIDVDGILSVYALVHSAHALAHRKTIIEAAEMGDFWGWGEPPGQRGGYSRRVGHHYLKVIADWRSPELSRLFLLNQPKDFREPRVLPA